MNIPTISRTVTATERPDSFTIKKLANGLYGRETKFYTDFTDKKIGAAAIDRAIEVDKALEMVFPSKQYDTPEEIIYLKQQNAELEEKVQTLTTALNASENGGAEKKESMGQ